MSITEKGNFRFVAKVDSKKDKKVFYKIGEKFNMTKYVRVVFKGRASIERALKSDISVEKV